MATIPTMKCLVATPMSTSGSPAVPDEVSLDGIKSKLRRLILKGLNEGEKFGYGSRSGFSYYIACQLRGSGWEDGAIIRVLIDEEYPVSEHIRAQTQHDPIEQAARIIRHMNEKGVERGDPLPPKTAKMDDFYSYLPEHLYLFIPTRTLWPASSINSILGAGASVRLDLLKPLHQMTWWPGKPMEIKDHLVFEDSWIPCEGKNSFNRYLPPPLIESDPKKARLWLDHLHKLFPDEPRTPRIELRGGLLTACSARRKKSIIASLSAVARTASGRTH